MCGFSVRYIILHLQHSLWVLVSPNPPWADFNSTEWTIWVKAVTEFYRYSTWWLIALDGHEPKWGALRQPHSHTTAWHHTAYTYRHTHTDIHTHKDTHWWAEMHHIALKTHTHTPEPRMAREITSAFHNLFCCRRRWWIFPAVFKILRLSQVLLPCPALTFPSVNFIPTETLWSHRFQVDPS